MSVFTNSASSSQEEIAGYVPAVLGLVGDTDPMAVMESTPDRLADLVQGLNEVQTDTPEGPDKWSIRHVLQHLADQELIAGYRLRMVLTHDRPPLPGYDQDKLVDRLHYDQITTDRALQDFRWLRDINLRMLRRTEASDLGRVGMHSERGEESFGHLLHLYAGHDLLHIRQIERIRSQVVGG